MDLMPGGVGSVRQHVVAAGLAVLVREAHDSGLTREEALTLMRDAPDKIEAALGRGARALVVYRLGDGARGIVSESDDKLGAFVDAAWREGCAVVGLNPAVIEAVVKTIISEPLTARGAGVGHVQ
jgi:hypothetical protein